MSSSGKTSERPLPDIVRNSLGRPRQRAGKLRRSLMLLTVNLVAILAIAIASFGAFSAALAAEAVEGNVQKAAVQLVRPNDMNTGALLLPSKEPGQYIEAPRLHSDVEMEINGPIARVSVTQRFENPSDGWVEGIYVFPLPEESAVDTLKMRIGDRLIEGVIKVREEARQIYEQAKREGKKAALLEQQRDNLFTNSVANIGPGETIIVNIEYQQTVRQDNGIVLDAVSDGRCAALLAEARHSIGRFFQQ